MTTPTPGPRPSVPNVKTITMHATIVIEAPEGEINTIATWVMSRLKASLDPSTKGMVAIVIRGPGGESLNVVGTPKNMTMADLNQMLSATQGEGQ